MRIVISEFISLDGVIQAPGGPEEDTDGGFAHGGWSLPFFDPEVMGASIGEGFATVEALLFGRRTFQGMAKAWPERAGDPFADQMNAIKKYVVSSTLTPDDVTWENAELVPASGALDAIRALRAQEGGDLSIMGSATLARSLLSADLVDELNLMIEPVSLGGGKRLFPDDGSARVFELVSTTLAATGVQICKFRPTGEPLVTGHSDELYEDGKEPVTPGVTDEPSVDPVGALVLDPNRSWTADEVWDTADRIAHLTRAATTGGRRVAVFAENAGESVIAHLGGLRSGASVVAINSHLAAPEAAYQLTAGDVALLIAGPATAERARDAAELAGACEVHTWDDGDWDDWMASAPAGPPPDDVPIVPNLVFTSGTTGTPKATHLPPNVFPPRASWAEFVAATHANRFVGLGRHLVVAPLHHTGPLNAVRALAAGTPVGVLPRFDPERTLQAIQEWQIASTTVVPTHLARLAALPAEVRGRWDVSSLRLVFLTGAACPVDVKRTIIEWWGPVILEAYGATEVGVTSSITSEDWLAHPGSVGRSVTPYTALVVDETGTELPAGDEGRLYFHDATGRGIVYEGDPVRTAAAHLEPGVFTLGEIGRIDEDGFVFITDRFSDMVVTGGVNVYPAEMEQVLVAHPGVADVAGIGLPHPDLGEQLVALVVPSDSTAPPSTDELQIWCEDRLSRFKCPREIRLVDDLGRNPLGKLDKRGLRRAHDDAGR